MDYDELTAVDILDGVEHKRVILKSASIYSESRRGGPIYQETNEGEIKINFKFFKTASPGEQTLFFQKIEEAVTDIVHEHSRTETWPR